MDSWPAEKLDLMKVGGNGKAKQFFQRHKIAQLPIREKYATDPAFMYKDKLSAEAQGRPFDEASWSPPERKQQYVSPAQNTARPEPGFASRYQGIGSAPAAAPEPDVGAVLAKGWATFASSVTSAAAFTAQKSKELAANAQTSDTLKTVQDGTATGLTTIASKTKTGWASLAAWANSMATPEEDGLSDVLKKTREQRVGCTFGSVSSEVAQPPAASPGPARTQLPLSPDSTPSQAKAADGWQDWGEDDDWDKPKPVVPSVSPQGKGVSLTAMKRPAKKAE